MHSGILKSAGLLLASAGLAFLSTGCKKIVPVTLTCNASAPSIYPGDQETVSATPANLVEKKNWDALYTWSGTGVSGSGTSATVATASLDPGSYTVKAEVKEGKKGKEGIKPGETADCSADFTVKPFEPPTLSCSASPDTVMSGGTSTITATGASPQNRPLTYSYSASAGNVSGNGTSAVLVHHRRSRRIHHRHLQRAGRQVPHRFRHHVGERPGSSATAAAQVADPLRDPVRPRHQTSHPRR